jgi:hypothetical protein
MTPSVISSRDKRYRSSLVSQSVGPPVKVQNTIVNAYLKSQNQPSLEVVDNEEEPILQTKRVRNKSQISRDAEVILKFESESDHTSLGSLVTNKLKRK